MKSHSLVGLVSVTCLLATASCGVGQEHSIVPRQFTSVDPLTVPWRELPLPSKQSLYRKTLLADMQTGTGVDLLRYPAGVVTPPHTHPHAHGMYILKGQLVTNHGTFGPGMFVWFPENEEIYHGATPDEDAVVVFIRHEPFEIKFVDLPSAVTGDPNKN